MTCILTQETKAILVQMCINAYKGKHGKVSFDCVGGHNYSEFNVSGCQGIVVETAEALYVAFEGTNEKEDWKANIDYALIRGGAELVIPYGNEDSKIRMHRGFVEMYAAVKDMLHTRVKSAVESGKYVYITGHSLGGALAAVCYIDMQYHYPYYGKMFGMAGASPAVGNKAFAHSFDARAVGRFANEWFGNDCIHDLPPFWAGYRHVGIKRRYNNLQAILLAPLKLVPLARFVTPWDHYPQKLLAAVRNERIPTAVELIQQEARAEKSNP